MNRNSNSYTIIYAIIMVVVVATVLTFAAVSLKPRQDANVLTEKMGAILGSIGEGQKADAAKDKDAYIKDEFSKFIKKCYLVSADGQSAEVDASAALATLDKLSEVFASKKGMPVFEAQLTDGKVIYVVPVNGSGLWGPVWGYIALNADCDVIYGAKFDHKGETPGLGAEIALPNFSNQFVGKQLFKDGKFQSIDLTKGVGSSEGNPYAVDAISGGTLTSNGVKAMLQNCLGDYVPFFESVQKSLVKIEEPVADTTNVAVAPTPSI